MRTNLSSIFWLLLLLTREAWGEESRLPIKTAFDRIAAYHLGEKPSGSAVHVVYFHAADREPLPDFRDRLFRITNDISEFYREEMEKRYSIKTLGVPFAQENGKLLIHVVRGRQSSSHYQYKSGNETSGEVNEALRGVIDPDRSHVLIVYGLCEQAEDGKYVFHAPYYGAFWSDHRHGLCHVADCPILDPLFLSKKDDPMVFKEHYYDRMEMSIAKFNSWYLGGIAHELGHGLGFPHDNGGPNEALGIALMGKGNQAYREDVWGGRTPAYLSLATALRFASHPLVTQSDKARWQPADADISDLTADAGLGVLRLNGRIIASVPSCAIIVSVWPTSDETDHGAKTFCAATDKDGRFEVEVNHLKARDWNIKLGCLMVNGAESQYQHSFHLLENGKPDTESFIDNRLLDVAEQLVVKDAAKATRLLTENTIQGGHAETTRQRLRLLRSMLDPDPELVDASKSGASQLFLSDAIWTEAKVGWGKVTRNRFWQEQLPSEKPLLKIAGEFFGKGLYAHSKSVFVFPIGGQWKSFTATVGLCDGANKQGSAFFRVVGDGKELFRSKVLHPGERQLLQLDIANVMQLELHADGSEGHVHNSWAIWADPLVHK